MERLKTILQLLENVGVSRWRYWGTSNGYLGCLLIGDLDRDTYMEEPEGHVAPRQEKKVCKLVNSLYGLKQALN